MAELRRANERQINRENFSVELVQPSFIEGFHGLRDIAFSISILSSDCKFSGVIGPINL
jgi:hypothetical protein